MADGTSWTTWSGLVTAHPAEVRTPRDVDEVVAAVLDARARGTTVRMVGTGHSFTPVAATDGIMLRPDALTGVVAVDHRAMTVTALPGTPLHVLNRSLETLGLSLHNMGDIAEQTVAGAVSTGTHGTGGDVASLSAQVVGVELVTGDGTLLRADAERHPEVLDAARLGLGALGVLTSVTFRVEPLFLLEAHEAPMRWEAFLGSFDTIVDSHDHAEAYWFPHTDRLLVKRNDRVDGPAAPLPRWRARLDDELLANTAFGWVNALGNRRPALVRPLAQVSARALSERRFTDVAHRVFTSSRRVVFRETEYAVPREAGLDALRELRALVERRGWRISFPVEIRVAPADDVPLSTAYGRDSLYLACHVNRDTDHTAYFSEVERMLRDHDGRPHWGKLHTRTAADLAPAYPRWAAFRTVRDRLDPDRVFGNAYLEQVLDPVDEAGGDTAVAPPGAARASK